MPSTTGTCFTAGTYRADCSCRSQIALGRGDIFPRCSECQRGMTWTLVRSLNTVETDSRANPWSTAIRSAMGRFLGARSSQRDDFRLG